MAERVHDVAQPQRRRHGFLDAPRQVQQVAAILAAQPAPQGMRCGGHLHAFAVQRRKFAQARHRSADGRDQ
jgi:hypothetical protein